jgi:anti-sigma factor RsiW
MSRFAPDAAVVAAPVEPPGSHSSRTDRESIRAFQRALFGTLTDFAPQGLPLVEGRLDSLNGQAVAVLVYERRRHFTNVYGLARSRVADVNVSEIARQGYSIIHWTRAGMNWWVASDLASNELESFANFVREGRATVPATP